MPNEPHLSSSAARPAAQRIAPEKAVAAIKEQSTGRSEREALPNPLLEAHLPAIPAALNIEPGLQRQNSSSAWSWVCKAYRENLSVSTGALKCMALAFAAGNGVAALLDSMTTPSTATAALTLGASFLAFYGTFIPQLIRRDRADFYDAEGRLSLKKCASKTCEYAGMILATEAITTPARLISMNLIREAFSTGTMAANITSFLCINIAYGFGLLPLIRQGLKSCFGSADQELKRPTGSSDPAIKAG